MPKISSSVAVGLTGAVLALGVFKVISGPQGTVFIPVGTVAHAQEAPKAAEPTPEELAESAYLILEKNCTGCHGEGKRLARRMLIDRGGYDTLVVEQQMVTPGKPDESELYLRMLDTKRPMPPRNAQPKPTAEDMALIQKWIEKGAPEWKQTAPAAPTEPAAPAEPAAPVEPAA